MVTAIPRLRKDIIDIVFPGMKEQELLKWVETDFESFLKEWKKQPGTAASLELITELQALYPEKFERPEIPLAEEEEPPIELTPEQVVRLPTTQTQDGWTFRDIAWNVHGEAINYRAISPTGEEYTKAELEDAIEQEELEVAPIPIEQLITDVFPDLTVEEFVDYVETDWEGFIGEMRGFTEAKGTLLRQLGYSQEEIDAFYRVTTPIPVPPQPPPWIGKFQLGLTKVLESAYGTELVQEVATNLNKDYFDVSNEEVETYIAANPDVAKRFAERQKEFPALTLWEEVKIGVQGLLKLPKLLGASILQAFQGQGGASVVDKDWADREIEAAQKDINEYVSEVQEEYGGRASLLGITATDIAQLPQNLAFSVTSMGAGFGVGLPILPFSRVGAYAAGTAASGYVAYQMTTYQIMQQYLELRNEESIAQKGRGITLEEENQLKEEFSSLAHRYGLWEAIPEAISNLAFVSILTGPLTNMLTKIGMKHLVPQILTKITTMYGQELLTETITQKGQSAIEVEAGLREGRISWLEAFKEIAPQTFLLTTVMAGAGQTIISSTNAVKKIRASLSAEIGETHPLYEGFLDEALKHYEETTIPFVKPPTITPTEAVVTPIAPEVPVTPAIEKFLATPDEQILRPSAEVIDALEARGFSRDYITTKMSIAEMKQALASPVPAVPEGVRQLTPTQLAETREQMGTLADYTDNRIFREFMGQGTSYWSESVYRQARAGKAIKIYRAVPLDITEIHTGAWVTQSRKYAELHKFRILTGEGHVIEGTARADELIAMTENEFFYAPEPKPPAVEVAKPPVAPEVLAERAITDKQTETINRLAKEKLIMTEEGKTKPQLRRLMKALTGKNRINQLTQGEADLVIEAVGRLEVKYGRPPVIPTGTGLITAEFAEKIPLLKEIGILEKVRPTRHVFEKMGLQQEVWKPAFEAEVRVYEEHQAFDKELNRIEKLVGKDPARRQLVFREIENPGSQVGLTFNEKRAVTWFRQYFDDWANRLNLPENKRRTNYVTHIFEEEISQQLKEKHPIDPELIKALDFITPKTIFNPFLQRRLGQKIGLKEDPFAAATAYQARALKVFYYEPLIQRIRVYQKYLPPHSAKYLSDFIKRITNRPLTIDKELNQTVKEFGEKIRGLPGGEALADSLTRGNPGGMVSYNLTSVLYTLWLGFKPTSAIRNLGQHSLIIAEVGPKHFADGIRLRVTAEGRAALKESLVLRSRRGAFIPALDSSFASKWTDSFREKALWMFRQADKQNVSDAFLAGYSEAKELFPNAPRELWINRGDEVAADTQYLYTKFNSFSMSQNSVGRVFSMLTTWTENWMELMTKWISRKPSQVYLNYTKQTGQAMPTKNWSQTYQSLLMYILIVGLGYVLKEKTRLKAWEYTGLTSLGYLADIVGGDFPALQAPGAVADLVVGVVTDDKRRLGTGWNALKSTFIPSIIKQMNYVAEGERDWLTLLLYLEGRDIVIKRLKNEWEKGWKEYPVFETPEDKAEYIEAHPEHKGWSDSKIRNQWRENNPRLEAQMFIVGQFTTLTTDKARSEVLRLIEEHDIDTELIDGYEKVFGTDTKPVLQGFQDRLGDLEKLVAGEEAEYFTTSNFATEVNRLVNIMGRSKVERDGNKLAIEYLRATDLWETYYNFEEDDARILWRQQFPDVEALLYLFGKVASFKNPKSAEILLSLMKKYDIPPEAIRAFIDKPERYDDLFTQKFELEQKWFDQTTAYENFGNTQAPNYIEDAELRKEARAKFKEDNPDWVADMRRIEAIDNDVPDKLDGINGIDAWADRGKEIDKFGSGSSEALVWLLDHPDTYDWAIVNELLEDRKSELLEREPILRIDVKYAKEDDWYNEGIPARHAEVAYKNRAARDAGIAEERSRYLADNTEYNSARYRRDAYGLKDENFNPFPDELVETYVDYYTNPDLKKPDDWEETSGTDEWYEDDWFLQENPEFHQALVDYERFTELRDLSKVPTREVFTLYQEYLGIEGSQARLNFRHAHPDLENWMVEAKGFKPVGDRWTTTDPELANKKYWLEQARHFKGLLADLGIREDITAEELTDEQFEQIKEAVRAFYE